MNKTLLILLGLLLSGCATRTAPLVELDAKRIYSVARTGIAARCPDFDLKSYAPYAIICGASHLVDRSDALSIEVVFISKRVGNIQELPAMINGKYEAIYTHNEARVHLLHDGQLLKLDLTGCAPPSTDDTGYIMLSEERVHTTDKDYLSNNGFEFTGTVAPRTQP